VEIREELESDLDAIREVNRLAFGGDAEGWLVDKLRAGGYILTSLVAVEADEIVGHALYSTLPIETDDESIVGAALAPVAVKPERQGAGIGSALIWRGLEICRERGCAAVVVLGHPGYYPRFGFSAELAEGLSAPYSGPALMALEIVPGSLDAGGTVRYAPPFAELE
jgi:putative acetyltransferase